MGSLTGSRVAGALARCIILDMCQNCQRGWLDHSLLRDACAPVVLSWIDNLYVVAKSVSSVVHILEGIEDFLSQKWSLVFKPSSRALITPAGSRAVSEKPLKWPLVQSFKVLGHMLQRNAGIAVDWQDSKHKLWGAFWANPGS